MADQDQDSYLKLEDGSKIWCQKIAGKEGFLPFVFIHGNAQNHTTADACLKHLNSLGHPVLVYDLPGHGKSDSYHDGKYSMERFTDTLAKVLQYSKIDKPVLIGHSMGGMIALQYAVQYPEKIAGLILVDTSDLDPIKANKTIPLASIIPDIIKNSYALFKSKGTYQFDKNPQLSENEILSAGLDCTVPQALEGNFNATNSYDVRQKLNSLNVPILILRGETDALMTQEMNSEMQKRMKNSRLVVIPKYGHNFLIQRPDLLQQTIEQNYDFIVSKNT